MRFPDFFNSPAALVIAHRGASGALPEQTLEAFDLAIDQGADAVELDVIPTHDGTLIARHENELSAATDVENHPSFAPRRRTKEIEGGAVTGWFAEDFSAMEIRSLRARQRFAFRDHSRDDQYSVPTLNDVLKWLVKRRKSNAQRIGLFIEIKHPTYFSGLGLNVGELLLQTLADHGLLRADSGIFAMSFETRVLRELRSRTDLPLIQLLDAPDSRPFDWASCDDLRTYGDLTTSRGLLEIAQYANGIGPWKRLIVPAQSPDADGAAADNLRLRSPTSLAMDAHAAGLFVCPWTFRSERHFLAADYENHPEREYEQFFRLGVDAVITDFPQAAVAARSHGSTA